MSTFVHIAGIQHDKSRHQWTCCSFRMTDNSFKSLKPGKKMNCLIHFNRFQFLVWIVLNYIFFFLNSRAVGDISFKCINLPRIISLIVCRKCRLRGRQRKFHLICQLKSSRHNQDAIVVFTIRKFQDAEGTGGVSGVGE